MKRIFIICGLFWGIMAGCLLADVSIVVQERDGFARSGEPVTLGVPFAKGTLQTTTPVRIVNPNGSSVDAQFKTMALWDNGSIKWLKCDFQADVSANGTATYTLKTDKSATASTELSVTENSSSITVTTGPLRFVVSKTGFNLLDQVRLDLDGNRQYSSGEEIISSGHSTGPVVTKSGTNYLASANTPGTIEIEEQGPMKVVIKVSGRHYNGSNYQLKYETRIYAYAGKPYIKLYHVYANGKSVTSLGSPLDSANNATFDRYGLDLLLNLTGSISTRFGGENNTAVSVSLSGGDNAALLQRDRTGTSQSMYYSISKNGTVSASGSRAPGWGTIYDGTWGMTVSSRYFWQKYPKGISFSGSGAVSFEPAPTAETFYVGMGTGDEVFLYFHSAADAAHAGQTALALNHYPLFPRTTPRQYADSQAFYPLVAGRSSYSGMNTYIDQVTSDHISNINTQQLYGNINFGDVPVGYWYADPDEIDATGWGSNYYDGLVLTPIRQFARESDLTYTDIFIPGVRHFMETACWNTYNANDWLNGFCPSYSTYHRATSHFQQHYGEGVWYYYYLTGDERAREVGLRAADSIMNQQWWGNNNVDCRMAYQRGSACLEAYKSTRDSRYLNHAKHLLVDKILATQDNYGLIGTSMEGVIGGEQTFMMGLYSDTLWKYARELSENSAERQSIATKMGKLADFIDTYARKSPGQEEYWNFFDAPNNSSPPSHDPDGGNPDATLYWWGKGLIAGTYAYAYDLTGNSKYKTLASNLLNSMWTSSQINWSDSQMWMKPPAQVMKNVLHAEALLAAAPAPTITVTSPNGGENWTAGSSQNITWTSSGSIANVKIEFSSNNGGSWSTVVSSTSNDGFYSWTVPNTVSSDCLIRVSHTGNAASDSSNAVFSISVSSGSGTIAVSKSNLYFTYIDSANFSSNQEFYITCSDPGLSWTVSTGASWLTCSPGSGAGTRKISANIDGSGLAAGDYTAAITVTAPNAANSPQTLTVYLTVKSSSQDLVPFGAFSLPQDQSNAEGSIAVTGWVLDDVEVESVKIYAGQTYIDDAIFVAGARSDVEAAYPDYPFNDRAGWGYMLLTNYLPNGGNGTYYISAIATDSGGHTLYLGTKTIYVDNVNATYPFGAIEFPTQGGSASGSNYRNWGWALTPQPAAIPTDGSTITVYIDGAPAGNPVYNLPRSDIQDYFPGYANTDGAVGYFDFDTGAYEDGVHTIAWSARDDTGRTGGIGSRFFTILNARMGNSGKSKGYTVKRGRFFVPGYGGERKSEIRSTKSETKSKFKIANDRNKKRSEIIIIDANRLNRMEYHLDKSGLTIHSGFVKTGGRLAPLPVGSTLDLEKQIFYWQPAAGFYGKYELVFFGQDQNGEPGEMVSLVQIAI